MSFVSFSLSGVLVFVRRTIHPCIAGVQTAVVSVLKTMRQAGGVAVFLVLRESALLG